MAELTHERLKELLDYNPETGVFTWKTSLDNNVIAGSEAGWVENNNRRRIEVDGQKYSAARLAIFWMTGEMPDGVVDHIDHDTLNDKYENLRVVSQAENCQNRKLNKNNSSGISGVRQRKNGKWKASINAFGKMFQSWNFDTKEQAIAARRAAEVLLGYHENHGWRVV